ncbi:AidA/PixA family protein [Pandoraea sp. NPDC087047]|uniref:AidA/PixA family protein n=1 Tax=Pandoraea sp. NPDC087047 TaxID=3364390 RepID=UPI003809E519
MSDAKTCGNGGNGGDSGNAGTIADVLLVIDTVTLLDKHPEAATEPVDVDGAECFALAPRGDALTGLSASSWQIDVRPGAQLRLRWTPLAMRGEHALLLQLSLDGETTLGKLQLHVEEHAVRYAPQAGTPEEAVAHEAPDAFWQAAVVGSGTAEVSVDALVTDRDANVLGRLRWPLRIIVP